MSASLARGILESLLTRSIRSAVLDSVSSKLINQTADEKSALGFIHDYLNARLDLLKGIKVCTKSWNLSVHCHIYHSITYIFRATNVIGFTDVYTTY